MDIKKMCMEQFEIMCKLIFEATDPEERSIHADKADGFILGLLWANVVDGDEYEALSKTITGLLFPRLMSAGR